MPIEHNCIEEGDALHYKYYCSCFILRKIPVSMSRPLPGENIPIWGSYLKALRAAPILVKSLTSSVAMATAEYISQKSAGVDDGKRMNTFVMWGLFLGIPNHFWQQLIATYGPDPLKSMWNFLATLAIDHVCWKVPILYIFVTYVTWRHSGENCTLRDALGAFQKSESFNAKSICRCVAYCPDIQFLGYSFAFKDIIYERNFAVLDHILGICNQRKEKWPEKY